ncbi:DUF397 domain-containing protein [Streptomyces sp. NPDC101213]|uniref:DUF397 domain-containing protein n=1 Tax=Streptomyces sp. NPDC101213 TaxID=3366130 RepID=UPI0037F9893E
MRVEHAPRAPFKSSCSGNESGECLEAATAPGTIHVRDSKAPARSTRLLRQGVDGSPDVRGPRLTTVRTRPCALSDRCHRRPR